MSEDRREKLMREAADIFLQLRDDPENPDLHARRDAFKARGFAEHDTYEDIARMWKASSIIRAPRKLRSFVLFLCALIGAGAFMYQPVRIALLADVSTRAAPAESTLSSGDLAFLDADTALVDATEGTDKAVELLEGAAFFTVEPDGRQFTVKVGDVLVTVVGTSFETAFVNDTVLVNVAQGQVRVMLNGQVWDLYAGDQFTWSNNTGADVAKNDIASMATWRADRLVLDGLTLGQAVAIVERRLASPVLFTNPSVKTISVEGTLDLSEPLVALRVLAETGGSRVFYVPGVGRIITNRY